MIRQIYVDYHLPVSPWKMSVDEVLFWYEPLVPSLIQMQKKMKDNRRT